jgi:NTP pyrophosphatase (non-canonical NTP hydrolase)
VDEIVSDIIQWQYDRNLIEGSSNQAQFVKLIEEAGELAGAIARGQPIHDHAGDIMVVLIGIMEREGTDMLECLQVAYSEIKDRKGVMINGVFIKDSEG